MKEFHFFTITWVLFGPKHNILRSRIPVYGALITENDSVFLTLSEIPGAFFHMRHVGGLNRHLTALEQTLADMTV